MLLNIVFNNATNSQVNFNITSSGGQQFASIHASPGTVVSGTVSGLALYNGSFYLPEGLSTPKFTGDAEVTLAVFVQPNTITMKP